MGGSEHKQAGTFLVTVPTKHMIVFDTLSEMGGELYVEEAWVLMPYIGGTCI